MATLKERTELEIVAKRKSLKQAEDALELVELLPPELQELDGEADTGYYGETVRITFFQFYNKGIDLLRVCKMVGTQGLIPKMSTPDNWTANGDLALPDEKGTVKIIIFSLPKPLNCRIEEYQETVTKYKAICNETGEEIK